MSGGSYNYLCHKEVEDFWRYKEDLTNIAHRLRELQCGDIADEVGALYSEVAEFFRKAEPRWDRLTYVLRALEYWDSNDWSEEIFWKEVGEYRGRKENGHL